MATFGLTPQGFISKSLEVIRAEINAVVHGEFGTSLDLSDNTSLGKFLGNIAEREALLWELLESVNDTQDPDKVEDAAQDAVCALTGTTRDAAKSSTVVLTLTGAVATLVIAGSQVSVTITGDLFATIDDATIASLTIWTVVTAYVVGDRVTNGGNAYLCTVAGTSAGAGGPTTEAEVIVDGGVTWRFLGNGVGAVDAPSGSIETGPVAGASGDIVTIETPVSGWDSVINVLDAVQGTSVETNEDLRVKREDELARSGSGTIPAVRSDLSAVLGVTNVTDFWNNTDTTDADGVPPHALESLIRGGVDQDIFDALLATMGGGIQTRGTVTGTATDAEGTVHAMAFSRPAEIDIHVAITLTFDATLYPADGDAQVEAAIVAIIYATGKDVVSSQIKAVIVSVPGVSGVAGVLDVVANIDTSASPLTENTIVITSRQLAVHDTSRITVVSGPATP